MSESWYLFASCKTLVLQFYTYEMKNVYVYCIYRYILFLHYLLTTQSKLFNLII